MLQNKERGALLDISNKQLANREEVISAKNIQLEILQKISAEKDSLQVNVEARLLATEKLLKKENVNKKFIRAGWISSAAVLIILLVLKK